MRLTNNSDTYIGFKVKVTSLYKYYVKPNPGIVLPHSSLDVLVKMHALKKAPADTRREDNIVIQCLFTDPDTAIRDINYMFKKRSQYTFEKRLKIFYILPTQPPSIAREGLNEGDLLSVYPQELQFPFELNKLISCDMRLTNKTDNYVAFKVYTTNPKKYCVLPNYGIVFPHSTYDIIVEQEAQREAPINMECKDSFLIQSTTTTSKDIDSDIKSDMFNKESGNVVGECIVKASYVSLPQPSSVAQERSDGVSVSYNGNLGLDSSRNPGILKNSYVSPLQPPPAAQERSDEGVTVSGNANLRPGSIKIPDILQNSYVSPLQLPSTAQEISDEGDLLSIHPQELQFPFKLNKEMFCAMKLTNNTDDYVAFKVKATNAKKYCVRPYIGIVMPLSTRYLLVMLQAQEKALANMECKDTFLLLSLITSPETTREDIISDMFNNESGNVVNKQKLKVRYVSPSQTLSAALNRTDLMKAPRSVDAEPEDNSSQKFMKRE